MPEESKVCTRFHPMHAPNMSDGSQRKTLLEAGNQVTIGPNGWIIDVWNPKTKKLYDNEGKEIGTRDEPFALPEATEVRHAKFETVLPAQRDEFAEGGDVWHALNVGFHVTLGGIGEVIDIWDPVTKTIRNLFGFEIGTRDEGYIEYRKKMVRNPMVYTNTSDDADMYDPEHWHMVFIQLGYQVTTDSLGNTIDIWDPATGKIYNADHQEIGTRSDPYPSDNNITNLKAQYEKLLKEIAGLRREAKQTRGAAKAKMHSSIASKLREYGTILFQYGRLIGRRRRSNKNEDRKRTKGPKPVKSE
ncbi:hypothetical protein ES705_34489 [subsurface metagenome]